MFKEELERLQKQQLIVPLGVDETLEWCNSFKLVPKPDGKVQLYLGPAKTRPNINKTDGSQY